MKALVNARLRILRGELKRSSKPEITDFRGQIRRDSPKCQTPLAPDKIAELVAQNVAGESVKTLAEWFGIPRQTVCRHAQRAGVIHQPKPFSDDDVTIMVALYQSGLGLKRIGAQMDASPMRIRRYLTGAGVVMRPPNGKTQIAAVA
ncbi:MAG: hypothetical protein FWD63_06225 [Propionibacteriaceae bacterium]|nr:hypothetical protein [Propionibacteriaceae bacterium]